MDGGAMVISLVASPLCFPTSCILICSSSCVSVLRWSATPLASFSPPLFCYTESARLRAYNRAKDQDNQAARQVVGFLSIEWVGPGTRRRRQNLVGAASGLWKGWKGEAIDFSKGQCLLFIINTQTFLMNEDVECNPPFFGTVDKKRMV